MEDEDKKMVEEHIKFVTQRADSLEIQLEELLQLVGMTRREWDFNRESLTLKSSEEFLLSRVFLDDDVMKLCGKGL